MLRQEPQFLNSPESQLSPVPIESMTYSNVPRDYRASETMPRTIDIHRELNRIEELVLDSPRIPLSNRTLIDEERLLEQLDAIRTALPNVLQEAWGVLQQKSDILQEAEQYAQEIIASAEQRAVQILDETGLARQAEIEAAQTRQQLQRESEILRDDLIAEMDEIRRQSQQEIDEMRQMAIAECQEIQQGADDYADRVLQNMEHQLTDMIAVIRNGRQQLQDDLPEQHPS